MDARIPTTTLSSNTTRPRDEGVIYVRAQRGRFRRYRRIISSFVFITLLALPFLQYQGRQAIWLDLAKRQYHFFQFTFWPQDLLLLAALFIAAAFSLFFVTSIWGRLWCGYLCPQTLWHFLFLWFEEKLEGAANKRRRLDKQSWSWNKLWRKGLKHAAWGGISLLTALAFAAYFVPVKQLWPQFFTLQGSLALYFCVGFFTLITYLHAGWLRTIVCTHMCPYARFQSVMLDKRTVNIAYDAQRGEPRTKRKRGQSEQVNKLGACIDCKLCVQVCPAGIDIRQGLQYECISCGACIDACDKVMDNMRSPRGLIHYASEFELQGISSSQRNLKAAAYGVVLGFVVSALVVLVALRSSLELEVLRERQMLSQTNSVGMVENSFVLKLANKTNMEQILDLRVTGLAQVNILGPKRVVLAPNTVLSLPLTLQVHADALQQVITPIRFELSNAQQQLSQNSHFFAETFH